MSRITQEQLRQDRPSAVGAAGGCCTSEHQRAEWHDKRMSIAVDAAGIRLLAHRVSMHEQMVI